MVSVGPGGLDERAVTLGEARCLKLSFSFILLLCLTCTSQIRTPMLERLADGLPQSLLLENQDRDLFLLVAASKPGRSVSQAGPSPHQVHLHTADELVLALMCVHMAGWWL